MNGTVVWLIPTNKAIGWKKLCFEYKLQVNPMHRKLISCLGETSVRSAEARLWIRGEPGGAGCSDPHYSSAHWEESSQQLLMWGQFYSTLEMKYISCIYFSWGLLASTVIPVSVGEMYTSLLNVKQAISVERKLISYLKTYIDHELERLEDIKRWVTDI